MQRPRRSGKHDHGQRGGRKFRAFIEIDNGRTLRRIRNVVVGRRNNLFIGSERGGERLAVAYTLADNCILLGIDPRRYLQETIDKRKRGHALSRMSELTWTRWAANQTRTQRPKQTRRRQFILVGAGML